MGRPALKPYEVDRITTHPHPDLPAIVRARARYRRESGGPLLDIYGKGKSEAAAKRDLKQNLAEKQAQHHGGSDQITTGTTVEKVAQVWLSEKRSQRPALAQRTLDEYAKWVGAYVNGTAYGRLTIAAAANVVRGEQHLQAVANGTHKSSARGGGEGAMRSARKVLHGLTDAAYRHGAIPSPSASACRVGRSRMVDARSTRDERSPLTSCAMFRPLPTPAHPTWATLCRSCQSWAAGSPKLCTACIGRT